MFEAILMRNVVVIGSAIGGIDYIIFFTALSFDIYKTVECMIQYRSEYNYKRTVVILVALGAGIRHPSTNYDRSS